MPNAIEYNPNYPIRIHVMLPDSLTASDLRHQPTSPLLHLLNLSFSLPTTSTSLNLPQSVFTSLTMAIMSIGSFATFLIVCRKHLFTLYQKEQS